MVRRAFALNVPTRLLWCAAGAGLAAFHLATQGKVYDIDNAFGDDAKNVPPALIEGYKIEITRAEIDELKNKALNLSAGCPERQRRGCRVPAGHVPQRLNTPTTAPRSSSKTPTSGGQFF